jgi:trimethylamine--corrinoid protein Co-methyltransferase
MTHADERYVGPRVKWELLTPDQVRTIHESTLDILSEVGVTLHSRRALDVVAERGATVDYETTVAKLPPELVEQALSTLPASFVLGARDPEYDLPLDGEHI